MSENRDALAGIRDEIHDVGSVIDSAVVLISGLVNRLAAALMGNDLAADITSLRDELDAQKDRLATAVAENTVAAEDSDDVYDPSPAESDNGSAGSESETENDSSSSDETGASESTGITGDDVVSANESDTVREGTGVTGPDSAEDTSATTDDVIEPESGAGTTDGSTTDSADDNGNAVA